MAEALNLGAGAPKPPSGAMGGWIRLGLFMIVAIFGGLGAWGAIAPLDSAVVASGVFIVDAKRRPVQHLEGGIVEEILVRDGDVVAKGDRLIGLSDARANATLSIVMLSLSKDRALEARLVAERDGHDEIAFPQDLLDGAETDPELAETLAAQLDVFEARRETIAGEIEILEARIGQLEREIEGLDAQAVSKAGQLELIEVEIADQETLFAKGQTTKSRLLSLKRGALELNGELGELQADSARAARQIGETKLEILQRQRALPREATAQLEEVQARLRDMEERRIAAEDVLSRLDITAPVDGVVVNLQVNTLGQVIEPARTLLELVPDTETNVIEVAVSPQDIDTVEVGQEARVRLVAFNQRTTPEIKGVVDYIAADSIVNEQTGQSYFRAHVRVPEDQIARINGRVLQPGMPAEVLIRTGARTAVEYLAKPMLDSLNRAWREK